MDAVADHYCVDCTRCMECFSAWPDSEESETERGAIDAHLRVCAACRRFAGNAARVTRLARTGVAVYEPDVGDIVEAARWCGCPCCRQLVGRLKPPPRAR
jgi:predicted anti-sigma-YlaC factor YlaD